MKIEFARTRDVVTFRVSDFSAPLEEALRMCFYQQDGGDYIKNFPASTPDLEKIMAHYEKHAEEMFLQLVYLRPIPWETGLLKFLERARNSQIDWWLTGSCAACLRGIALNPHDIDIMVDGRDVGLARELFRDVIIEPIIDTQGWVTKDFGVLFMDCRIDIASDPSSSLDEPEPADCGPYAKEHLETIDWRGYRVRIPPLALQLNVNRRRQRLERVRLIEEFMQAQAG